MTQSDDNRIVANLVAGSTPVHSTIQARDIPVQSTLGIVPSATTERKGIIRIATNEEAQEEGELFKLVSMQTENK